MAFVGANVRSAGLEGTAVQVQAVHALGLAEAYARDATSISIVAVSPLERPGPRLVAALCEAGALGVLDLGRDAAVRARSLAAIARRVRGEFGVRVPDGETIDPAALPNAARVVICGAADVARFAGRIVLAQVTSLAEARA